MGAGVLLLIGILLYWGIVALKEHIEAVQYHEATKDMTWDERSHYRRNEIKKEFGMPTLSYEEDMRTREERGDFLASEMEKGTDLDEIYRMMIEKFY